MPLPHTFRPVGVRLAAYALLGLLLLVSAVTWFAFPPDVRDRFTLLQRGTLLAFGVVGLAAGHALARCRVVARPEGLTVVNGYRTRSFDWHQVVAVTLRPGSPWAELDLSDGTAVSTMGIQGSEGARATTQVRQLRALVEQHSATERDD